MFNIRKDYLILIGGMSLWGGLLFAVFIYLSNMFTATQAPTQGEWQQDDPRLLPQPSVVIEIPVEVPVTVFPTAIPEDEMLARISSYWPGSIDRINPFEGRHSNQADIKLHHHIGHGQTRQGSR